MSIKTDSKTLGYQAENLACVYLQKQGLRLIERNFTCRRGEIDLILQDQWQLVFVEVRYRHNNRFGDSLDTITTRKRFKLLRTAHYYLQRQGLEEEIHYRFDVIAITTPLCLTQIQWIQNAF